MSLTSKDSLVLFFGLFWTVAFAPLARYRLFDIHRWTRYKIRRALWAVLLVDLVPLVYLVGALNVLPNQTGSSRLVGDWVVPGGVWSSAVAALGLMGVRRLVHALVATEPFRSFFYHKHDREDQLALGYFDENWPSSPSFLGHFVGGALWLASAGVTAILLSRLGY